MCNQLHWLLGLTWYGLTHPTPILTYTFIDFKFSNLLFNLGCSFLALDYLIIKMFRIIKFTTWNINIFVFEIYNLEYKICILAYIFLNINLHVELCNLKKKYFKFHIKYFKFHIKYFFYFKIYIIEYKIKNILWIMKFKMYFWI